MQKAEVLKQCREIGLVPVLRAESEEQALALASAIAVGDVTYQSIMIWTQRDNVLALMIVILLFFGLLTWLVSLAGRWLERRLWIPGYGA